MKVKVTPLALAVGLVVIGCSSSDAPGPDLPRLTSAGTAGLSSTGGANGSAGANGGSGVGTAGSDVGGTGGSSGAAPMGDAGTQAGGAGAGGSEPGTAGSASGMSGAAGSSPGPVAGDDRCDVAKLDPAKPPKLLNLTGNLGTHDPVVIEADGRFYLFSTGNNIGAKTSNDLLSWQGASDVLTGGTRPAWLAQQVPGVSNLWAPDISFFGGAYHLYYSASTFGKNRSCIGHLSRASLTSGSWADKGEAICSNVSDKVNYNAIDPNVVVDTNGTPWLSFGSFWGGIQLIKLKETGERDGTSLVNIASRPSAGGALEAPFIVRRCGYYYLFVSFDRCCQGASSTYNIRVGRSANVEGPYVDRTGKAMLEGGGTLVLQGGDRYKGPGHNAVIFSKNAAYNVYHSYDANSNGASVLRIAELAFDGEGWPVSGGP